MIGRSWSMKTWISSTVSGVELRVLDDIFTVNYSKGLDFFFSSRLPKPIGNYFYRDNPTLSKPQFAIGNTGWLWGVLFKESTTMWKSTPNRHAVIQAKRRSVQQVMLLQLLGQQELKREFELETKCIRPLNSRLLLKGIAKYSISIEIKTRLRHLGHASEQEIIFSWSGVKNIRHG